MNLIMVIALSLVAAAADSGLSRPVREEASGKNLPRESARLTFFTSFCAWQNAALHLQDGGGERGLAFLPLLSTPWNGGAGAPRYTGAESPHPYPAACGPAANRPGCGVNTGRAPPLA